MEKFVKINLKLINNGRPDFGSSQVIKGVGARREYKIDGQWIPGSPTKRPDETQIIFDLEDFRAAKDAYAAWQKVDFFQRTQKEKPELAERPDEVIRRLLVARLYQTPLTLFTPWGVRPNGEFGEKELRVLDRLREFQMFLQERSIKGKVMIMPADLYATQINNNVDTNQASNYFSTVRNAALDRSFDAKSWSEIKKENKVLYDKLAQELTISEIEKILSPTKILEAKKAAERRSGYTDPSRIEEAAYAYLKERIIEAVIIEKQYTPIKVSAVPKNKDNEVDRDLPRIYIFPDWWELPWLK